MKILLILTALVGVCLAYLEEDYEQIRHGSRPDNVGDAVSTIKCRVGYTITKCECDRPEACKGSWVRVDKDGQAYCEAFNRPGLALKKIPAVLAKVTCAQLLVHISTGYLSYSGGKKKPEAKCPKNYKLTSCSFTSTYITQEKPEPRVTRSKGTCTIKKSCKRCRVQAHCLRDKQV